MEREFVCLRDEVMGTVWSCMKLGQKSAQEVMSKLIGARYPIVAEALDLWSILDW